MNKRIKKKKGLLKRKNIFVDINKYIKNINKIYKIILQ